MSRRANLAPLPVADPVVKLPDPNRLIEDQDEDVLFAMLVFGESRGESDKAKLAVANVVRNRVLAARRGYGLGFREVCLKAFQFSCFLPRDPNRAKLLHPFDHEMPEVWGSCWRVAQSVYKQLAEDNTDRSTHYFDDSLLAKPPKWAEFFRPTVKIGRLNFYRADAAPSSSAAAAKDRKKARQA